jgi:hypothetical protein
MKKNLLQFEEAHKVVLEDAPNKNILGYNDWQRKYIKSSDFPIGVPRQPHITYKGKGWVSWGHWLGTGNRSNKEMSSDFWDHDQARDYILTYCKENGINSASKWHSMCASQLDRLKFVPTNPHRTYKGKGWVSWGHWLDTGNSVGAVRKYSLNDNFFDKWSSEMSYVLGFWFADGCFKHGNKIVFHQKEKYILDEILLCMESDHKIYFDSRGEGCHYVEICSDKVYQSIREKGGVERKSLICELPDVPDEYLSDFTRGYFDGDGCITYDKCSSKYMSYITSASDNFLLSFVDRLRKVGIDGRKNNQISIKFNAINTIRLGDFMYKNSCSLRLVRKYELFKKARRLVL